MAGFGTYYDFNCGNKSNPGVGCNAYNHSLCRTCEFAETNISSHSQCPEIWCLKNASRGKVPLMKLNNGVMLPQIALGVWQYDNDTAKNAIALAFQAGFTQIDTVYALR